jgi:acyl-CoA synthetase (AMP-forming)/AMP-acid ligase II
MSCWSRPEADSDDIVLMSTARSVFWLELERASAALGWWLQRLGLRSADLVAVRIPNRIDSLVHHLACFEANLVATTLN